MARVNAKIKNRRLMVKAKFSSNERIDDKEFSYFSGKGIRGFLKPFIKSKLGIRYIEYTGPAGISLEERLKRPLTRHDFFFMMEQIVDIVEKTEKNSLNIEKIIFDLPVFL